MSVCNKTIIARINRVNARAKTAGFVHRIHVYEEQTVSGVCAIFYIYNTLSGEYTHHRTHDINHSVGTLAYYQSEERKESKVA